jgi:hypothetical protein
LLIAQLPGHVPTLRVQIWRALKASGAEQLRDGAYLLPNSAEARGIFEAQRIKIQGAGGLVYTPSLLRPSLLNNRAPSPYCSIEQPNTLKRTSG